ncbi:uncharacterized protein PHACADRAFT_259825 [Phanerochaete carnosa HHB-10118-sp]|uniref:Uncharacterized protein n=1 Tax=Phanerochaete carnosa (strain HHB-10118-sp) TaxID=650164 RepID=K5W2T8_PHACS|nr:uncharacterized protein PHACADRAFT_259825 [Phanerochaete carnosa HHB-10118-sp]EKM53440.1 hypothetical protein PHACADRAFT_259825 [Phanerochaete carnosa HHB-10118-sp]
MIATTPCGRGHGQSASVSQQPAGDSTDVRYISAADHPSSRSWHCLHLPRPYAAPTATTPAPIHIAADGTNGPRLKIFPQLNIMPFSSVILSFPSVVIYSVIAAFAWLISLLYLYVLLLGLSHLDSLLIPLSKLSRLVAAEAVADHDHHADALALLHGTWKMYLTSLGRDLEMASALCAAVLAYVIPLMLHAVYAHDRNRC